MREFPLWLSRLRPGHSIYEDAGLIPGLLQWVKDPAMPQAVVCITDVAQIWHGCGCGAGLQLQLRFDPKSENYATGARPAKRKKERKKFVLTESSSS